jgi:hypothetical protein
VLESLIHIYDSYTSTFAHSLSYRFILLRTIHQMLPTKPHTRNECTGSSLLYFLIMCRSSLSSPPHLVCPALHPCSGKNFGAVCSGVVDVLLDELLLPSRDTRLPCLRICPAGCRVGNGVPVVIVLAGFAVGKILVRVVAVVVGS